MQDNGVVEFVAGKVYSVKWVAINSTLQENTNSPYMPSGIDGNGAILKGLPESHHSLLYLLNPQNSNNKDFFIRNLTIDCNENCDYGLRVWGGSNFLIENTTVRRTKVAGVFLQGQGGWNISDVTLRNVMARNNRGRGFHIYGNKGTKSVRNVRLENAYAHFNDKEGFLIEGAAVDMIGCGAERNGHYGIAAGSAQRKVDGLTIIGGYTENNSLNSDEDIAIYLHPGKVSRANILGGRLIGKFSYNKSRLRRSVIHSYGHTKIGFNKKQGLSRSFLKKLFSKTQRIGISTSRNRGYTDIAEYFLDGTAASKLRSERNIHLVNFNPVPAEGNYTQRINSAIESAMATSGIVAFEPGGVYGVDAIRLDKALSQNGSMPVGFLGNGSTLTAISQSFNAESLLTLRGVHASRPPSNGDTWYDSHNFFIRGVALDVNGKFRTAMNISVSVRRTPSSKID
jgi:hypothetical protein